MEFGVLIQHFLKLKKSVLSNSIFFSSFFKNFFQNSKYYRNFPLTIPQNIVLSTLKPSTINIQKSLFQAVFPCSDKKSVFHSIRGMHTTSSHFLGSHSSVKNCKIVDEKSPFFYLKFRKLVYHQFF